MLNIAKKYTERSGNFYNKKSLIILFLNTNREKKIFN